MVGIESKDITRLPLVLYTGQGVRFAFDDICFYPWLHLLHFTGIAGRQPLRGPEGGAPELVDLQVKWRDLPLQTGGE